ncbi:MAG: hypothetical protein Q9174_004725 [Haloplaca sp. 1 TL-2023]
MASFFRLLGNALLRGTQATGPVWTTGDPVDKGKEAAQVKQTTDQSLRMYEDTDLPKEITPAPFPFEKLPLELQTMIVGHALHKYVEPLNKYIIEDQTNLPFRRLMLVSKSMATIVRYVMTTQIPLVIKFGWGRHKFNPSEVKLLNREIIIDERNMPSHLLSEDTPLLHRAHNIEIDLTEAGRDLRTWNFWPQRGTRCDQAEQMRLVCDALVSCTGPTDFYCPGCDGVHPPRDVAAIAKSHLPIILNPLRRLRVASTVTFLVKHGFYDFRCEHKSPTARRLRYLDDNSSQLMGEELTRREKIWTELKELAPVRGRGATQRMSYRLFDILNLPSEEKEGF